MSQDPFSCFDASDGYPVVHQARLTSFPLCPAIMATTSTAEEPGYVEKATPDLLMLLHPAT